MPTCIYCQRIDPPCGFNSEHVIPQALGRFEGDAITLTQEVCGDCNQYFGDTLELFLNRDSAEAMLRFRHNLKDPADVRKMFPRRVRVRLPRDGSQWGGVHLDFVPPPPGEPEPFLDLVPQFGFERRDSKGWEYLTEPEFREADIERIRRELGPKRVILFNSDEARDRLIRLTIERGMPLKKQGEFRGFPPFAAGRVSAELEFTFDNALAQAVAKIGFNYLAKTHGAELALRTEFDAVRQFIRNGKGKPSNFVTFGPGPVLRDSSGPKPARGHLLTVGWDEEGRDVLARVCPFQHITYIVRLSADFAGVWRPIESAHLYDLGTKRAERLAAAVRIVIPGAESR